MTDAVDLTVEIQCPEPSLTPDVLITRARELRVWLRDNQAETERLTGIPAQTHEAFLEAGFYRVVQPRRFGGYEFDLRTMSRVVTEVARGCPSSGWNLCLATSHALIVGALFSAQAQREAFGPAGDFRAPLPVAPTGTAVKRPEGYLVNGRWDYASGVNVSTHFLAGVRIIDGDRETTGVVLVPSGWRMLDNWGDVLGMRGSGSNSVVVDEVLVPDRYVVERDIRDLDVTGGTIGSRLHQNPMYAGRMMTFFNIQLVSIMVGAAWAAIDEYEHILTTKNAPLPPFRSRALDPVHQRNLGVARGLADGAERIVLSVADDYIECAARGVHGGEPFSALDDQRLSVVSRQAGQMAARAVEMLAAAAGSGAMADGQRMQRYLRDVLTYKTHVNAQHEMWATGYGRAVLGLDPE